MTRAVPGCLIAVLLAAAAGCGGGGNSSPDTAGESTADAPVDQAVSAVAQIEPKSGSALVGTATFTESAGIVVMNLEVHDAPPGEHAVHLHEIGDCGSEDAKSAGGHWNPTAVEHGKWGHAPFHLGDVGNLAVGDDGYGSLTFSTDLWSIGTGADNDILGHSIVIHDKPDDFKTQPTGAAGARIGCGVIQ